MSLKDIEIIIEKLEKTMKNGGLGGAGSVKMDGAVMPTRNTLSQLGHNSAASKIKIPSVAQSSKKNPIKSAQQIHNKDIKDIKMKEAQRELAEVVKTLPNGQWKLVKTDNGAKENVEIFSKSIEESKPKTVVRKLKKSLEERLEILEKRCWKGYEPTPGKKAYDEGSCRPIKKKECECDDCECDSVEKSKYPGVYDINDNARRKANNVDAEESPIQSMKRVKKYGAGGPSKLDDTVKELRSKSKKQPVKVYTKEELDEINDQKKAA